MEQFIAIIYVFMMIFVPVAAIIAADMAGSQQSVNVEKLVNGALGDILFQREAF